PGGDQYAALLRQLFDLEVPGTSTAGDVPDLTAAGVPDLTAGAPGVTGDGAPEHGGDR
ncbi:glutamyl-tRNA reductase, partial [Solwaraspora sp. WMMA2056]